MLLDPRWTILLFALSTNIRPFWYKTMENWKVALATGQQMMKQVKKVLSKNLKDIFWAHDEAADVWVARHFEGGRRLTKRIQERKTKRNQ